MRNEELGVYKGVDGGLEAAASILVAVEQIERGAARRQKHRVARHGKATASLDCLFKAVGVGVSNCQGVLR